VRQRQRPSPGFFTLRSESLEGLTVFKNVASQTVTLSAYDSAAGTQKTGDAANLLFYVDKDDAGPVAITANSGVPSEISSTNSKGDYKIALAQAETNADKLHFTGKSSTSGIVVVSKTIYTVPAAFTSLSIANSAVSASLDRIKDSGLTETGAGYLKGSFVKFFDKQTPTGTINSLPDALPRAAGGVCDLWGFGGVAGTFASGIPEVKVASFANNSLTENATSTGWLTELRTYLFGADVAAQFDASGYHKVSNGTGTGQLNLSSGNTTLADSSLTTAKLGTFALAKTTNITGFNDPAASANATAVWQDLLAGSDFSTVGSIGKLLKDDIDAAISSRSTYAGADTSGTTTLLSRLPSGIFTGMSSLPQWLGLLAGKQLGNSTARTELRATGGGAGTFDETTDSLEANRDNLGDIGGEGLLIEMWQRDITNIALLSGSAAQKVLDTYAFAASILDDTGSTGVVVNDHTSAALSELRTYLHGADVASQIDGSGYHKLSDGTGAGQIDLTSGLVTLADASLTTAKLGAFALAKTTNITGFNDPTPAENAAGLLDASNGVETGITVRQAMRAIASRLAGDFSGAGTGTEVMKAIGGTATRLTATVDGIGNVTWSLSL
jgi:hypothetical protein